MGSNEASSAYGEYLERIGELAERDDMITIPPEVLLEVRHEPVLAQFIFNPFGPTLQTLSIARGGDAALPSMLVRRSLNPHAEPYQVPIGLAYGTPQERALQEAEILALFLQANGVGQRETSTPFVTATPCAVVLGPRLLPSREWFRSAYLEAARSAELDLAAALDAYYRHGTDLWAAADESVRSGIDRVLSALRDDGGAAEDADSADEEPWQPPGTEPRDLPSEEAFAQWWPVVTGEPMIRATLTSFPLAWNGPGPMVQVQCSPRTRGGEDTRFETTSGRAPRACSVRSEVLGDGPEVGCTNRHTLAPIEPKPCGGLFRSPKLPPSKSLLRPRKCSGETEMLLPVCMRLRSSPQLPRGLIRA